MNPPTHAPSAAELLADAVVRAALDRAWSDSLPADPTARHEEGGWIYLDLTTGRLSTQRCLAVGTAGIDLSKPPTVYGSIVVGKFLVIGVWRQNFLIETAAHFVLITARKTLVIRVVHNIGKLRRRLACARQC